MKRASEAFNIHTKRWAGLAKVARKSTRRQRRLLTAVWNDDIKGIKRLLDTGALAEKPVDWTIPQSQMRVSMLPAVVALVQGHYDVLKLLLEEGADPKETLQQAKLYNAFQLYDLPTLSTDRCWIMVEHMAAQKLLPGEKPFVPRDGIIEPLVRNEKVRECFNACDRIRTAVELTASQKRKMMKNVKQRAVQAGAKL